MILLDVNVLVYAFVRPSRNFAKAQSWLNAQLSGAAGVGMPWHSLLGFVRLVTNPRVVARPATVAAAWDQVEQWLDATPAWTPAPGPRHPVVLGDLLRQPGMTAALVPDAHLAALAIEHGLTLCSTDHDFARFKGLRWTNPLAAP